MDVRAAAQSAYTEALDLRLRAQERLIEGVAIRAEQCEIVGARGTSPESLAESIELGSCGRQVTQAGGGKCRGIMPNMTATPVPIPPMTPVGTRAAMSAADLWDPASGRFDTARLRLALVVRGMTPDQFAQRTTCGRTSVYKALSGAGVRDRTAIAILTALAVIPRRLSVLE